MEWQIAYFREDLQDAILAFPSGIQARYIHLTERMIAFGPDLGMPHTRAMGKGLFEFRMKAKGKALAACSFARSPIDVS